MKSALAVIAVASAVVAVSASAPQQSRPPQFRGGTDLVAVDFLAVRDDGTPVPDLQAKDVVLKVDGKPREIRSFQFVKVAASSSETKAAPPPPLPLPFGSNDEATPSRSVIVLVDHEHIRAGQGKSALTAAQGFIDQLQPADRVGVVTLPNGKVEVDLTTNRARAREALERVIGRGTRRGVISNISLSEALTVLAELADPDKTFTKELVDRECKFAPEDSFCRTRVVQDALALAREEELMTRTTLRAVADVIGGLAGVEAPTTVLYMSGALVRFPDTHLDLAVVARAVARARVQMFVIQPDEVLFDAAIRDQPPSATKDNMERLTGLEDLAGVTGGETFRLSGAGTGVFRRIADTISAHYLLGFEPQASERDDKPHKLELTVAREGVSLRVRPSFIIDDPNRAPLPAIVPETLVRKMDVRRDLPLRAAAFAFRDTDSAQRRIVVAVEPSDPMTTIVRAVFALVDVGGQAAAQWTEEGVALTSRPIVTAAAVPPGDYRLRVVALDAAGRLGTVDYEFTAELTQAPTVIMSTLMTGTITQGGFRPALLPSAADPTVTGYFEFYGSFTSGDVLSVRLEVAASAEGPALASAGGSVVGTSVPTRFIATGDIPLKAITVPELVVRAILSVNDRPVGRVTRTLRRHP
jgi:VWFA-related protein